MKRLFSILFFMIFLFSFKASHIKKENILVVLAHPDDETAFSPVLKKYSKTHKIHLLIATDGRYGQPIKAISVDSLIELRKNETRCACNILGLETPVFLGFTDGFDSSLGIPEYFKRSKLLKEKITEKIKDINPEFILTFGPDGDTGHSDHRMISDMTTEIILSNKWASTYPLYYLGWTKADSEKFKMIGGLNTVHPDYLNVSIKYSQDEENEALKTLDCYKSQFSEDEISEWKTAEIKDTTNTLYFRQLILSKKRKEKF
ncbi:PIG-L family deacetylase [Algoriphagus resistens]|uniref:PIG-L family deacetylase n=1 Tax=Algoriphagus resistens TaxID=1750590 RepID=UPI0009E6F55D|nr:PIG-L family deacetylase [Algoriphagus resistens]